MIVDTEEGRSCGVLSRVTRYKLGGGMYLFDWSNATSRGGRVLDEGRVGDDVVGRDDDDEAPSTVSPCCPPGPPSLAPFSFFSSFSCMSNPSRFIQ